MFKLFVFVIDRLVSKNPIFEKPKRKMSNIFNNNQTKHILVVFLQKIKKYYHIDNLTIQYWLFLYYCFVLIN